MKAMTDDILEEITNRLVDSIKPQKIYLFGSHAAGKADDDSDVDLLMVVADTEKSTRDLAIKGRKSLWYLAMPFDLIVCTETQFSRYSHVKNTIMNEVLCEGRIVYGS